MSMAANASGRASGRPAVFLDRDGTLNVERHYLSDPDEIALLPGVVAGLRALCALGLPLVVVTNQSGLGRGFFDAARLDAIHRRLADLLAAHDLRLDGIYVCPHRPEEGCACRKPRPQLIARAAAELGLDPRRSFVIGDKACDIELGRAVGATTLLVRTGYGAAEWAKGVVWPDFVVRDLEQAASFIKEILSMSSASPATSGGEALLPSDSGARLRKHLLASIETKQRVMESCEAAILAAAERMVAALGGGRKLLLCGNGGSAADCQHIAAEFVSTLDHNRPRPGMGALALTTDTSFLTANANDFGFEGVFARQVQALGQSGDVLIGISTSGNSANVVRAVEQARAQGLVTIGLTGGAGGRLAQLADVAIRVPSQSVQHIQEAHITIGHVLCHLVEEALAFSDRAI